MIDANFDDNSRATYVHTYAWNGTSYAICCLQISYNTGTKIVRMANINNQRECMYVCMYVCMYAYVGKIIY